MNNRCNNILGVLVLLAFSVMPETGLASVCLLAASDEDCVRIDATGTLEESTYGRYKVVTLNGTDPSSWEGDVDTTFNPDWVEFNIVFDPLGTSIEASRQIRFTDKFKLRGVIGGEVKVSLWLTDEDHNIIEGDWGSTEAGVEGKVGSAKVNYDNYDYGDVDANGFHTFDIRGAAYFEQPVQWWDYHLAFDLRNAIFDSATTAATTAIELLAPTTFNVCESGEDIADGPCAFGMDIGIVLAVPAPTNILVLSSSLFLLLVSFRRRRRV